MCKRILIAILIVELGLSFVSCGMHGDIEVVEYDILKYQGANYYLVNPGIFDVNLDEENESPLVKLGWHFNLPYTWQIRYYSYVVDEPNYIFTNDLGASEVWVKQDYDYMSDTFVIEGTSAAIVFSQAFTDHKLQEKHTNDKKIAEFYWHSQTCPRIGTMVWIYLIDNTYYIEIPNYHNVYEVSSEFLALLMINEIVTEPG